MPYPTLNGPLSLRTVDPSGEFTCSQEFESASSGVAILNWTHAAGVELQYNTTPSYPVCLEYAYIAENISWGRNATPTVLKADAYIQIKETGSFQTVGWPDLFYIQLWILGATIQRHELVRAHQGQGYQHLPATVFGYQGVYDAFAQHPESNLQLAVAIVPTSYFWEYSGNHPWMTDSGSVEVIVSEMHFEALYRKNADMPRIRTSKFNNTWKLGVSDSLVDSCMAADGSLYILSQQQYSSRLQTDTLTKINSKGEVIWTTNLNATNSATWKRVLATLYGVFLVGTISYITGQIIDVDTIGDNGAQSHAFNLNFTDVGYLGGMDIGPDGFLYVGTSHSGSGEINSLSKITRDGSIIWEEPFGDSYYGFVSSVQTDEIGNVFTFSQGQIIKWDSNGNQLWQLNSLDNSLPGTKSFYVLRDGSSIITALEFTNNTIVYLSPGRSRVWSFTAQIKYAPDWIAAFYIPSIAEGPSGLLYALYSTYNLHQSSIVVVMNREGAQVENFTASFGRPFTYVGVPDYTRVYVTYDNELCLLGATPDENYDNSLTLAIYEGEPGVLGGTEVVLLSTSAATGVVLGALVYLEYYKKHRELR